MLDAVTRPAAFIARELEGRKLSGKYQLCTTGDDVILFPSCRIENFRSERSAISIGSHSRIRGQLVKLGHGGLIKIGNSCFVGENSRVWSGVEITIGDRVLISHDVNIHDTISHSLSAASRHRHVEQIFAEGHPRSFEDLPPQAPILIEDDVWIGFSSTILKGVTIGRGAVVGAASVVTKSVEPFTVVAGNPARVIGKSRA